MAVGLTMLRRYSSVDHQYHHPTMHYATHTNNDGIIAEDASVTAPHNPVQSAWLSLVKRLRSNLGTGSSTNNSSHGEASRPADCLSPSARNCRRLRRSISTDSSKRKNSGNPVDSCPPSYPSVRNIYRKPSTRSRLALHRSDRGEALRQQFARCRPKADEILDPQSNDEEDEELEDSNTSGSSVDSHSAPEDSIMQRKPSILRRPRSKSVPSFCQSPAMAAPSPRQHAALTKQTSFREEVDVIYYDDEMQPVTKLSRASERLKDGVRLLVHMEERDASDINENSLIETRQKADEVIDDSHENTCPLSTSHNCPTTIGEIQSTSAPAKPDSISQTTLCDSAGPMRSTVSEGKQAITLLIEISDKCLKSRTCVKAMSGGRTLMVMTYQAAGGPESTQLHQFVEKINLPVTIDPYGVKAQVKKSGQLYIEAPLRLT